MAGADHGRRPHGARPLRRRVPARARGARRRARAAVRGRRVRRSASRTRSSSTSPAGARASGSSSHELCRVARRVFVTTPNRWFPLDPHTLLPFAHWLPPRPARDRLLPARGFDDVLDPLGPKRARGALPVPGADRQQRDDARRRGARMSTAVASRRGRPVWALHVLVVGLALHNFVMAELWAAGVRGSALDVVSAWKDVLLARRRSCSSIRARGAAAVRRRRRRDWLAVAFGGVRRRCTRCCRRRWLGGGATHHGVLLGLRHDGLPVAAYFLGRGLDLTGASAAGSVTTILATAAASPRSGSSTSTRSRSVVAASAPGWFRDSSGSPTSGCPACRRTSSTTRATASAPAARLDVPLAARDLVPARRRAALPPAAPALRALPLARAPRRRRCSGRTRARRARARARVSSCSRSCVARCSSCSRGRRAVVRRSRSSRPTTTSRPRRTSREPSCASRSENAKQPPGRRRPDGGERGVEGRAPRSFRDGLRTVVHHPQGFGLGNAGVTADRTHVTQGRRVDLYRARRRAGLLGGLVFVAWSLIVLCASGSRAGPGSRRRSSRCSRSGCRRTSSACRGSPASSGRSPAGGCYGRLLAGEDDRGRSYRNLSSYSTRTVRRGRRRSPSRSSSPRPVPGIAPAVALLGAEEPLEEHRLLVRWNAHARVCHDDLDLTRLDEQYGN